MSEDWRAGAAAAGARVRAIWTWCTIGALAGGGATAFALAMHGPARWAVLTAGIAITLWAFVLGTVTYMRRIDEQERMANLWGAYVGICAYLLLFAASLLAKKLGQPIPDADTITFFAVCAITFGVFAWRRFR